MRKTVKRGCFRRHYRRHNQPVGWMLMLVSVGMIDRLDVAGAGIGFQAGDS